MKKKIQLNIHFEIRVTASSPCFLLIPISFFTAKGSQQGSGFEAQTSFDYARTLPVSPEKAQSSRIWWWLLPVIQNSNAAFVQARVIIASDRKIIEVIGINRTINKGRLEATSYKSSCKCVPPQNLVGFRSFREIKSGFINCGLQSLAPVPAGNSIPQKREESDSSAANLILIDRKHNSCRV